jgi:PIN domain nuclease of toxin-antitoxin system
VCDKPFQEVTAVAYGENWTRDPFDRMIVAQAKSNGLSPLISSDEKIKQHYINAIW